MKPDGQPVEDWDGFEVIEDLLMDFGRWHTHGLPPGERVGDVVQHMNIKKKITRRQAVRGDGGAI